MIERRDLKLIKGLLHERLELGEHCDNCSADFADKKKRTVVMTSVPKNGELPEVEILLFCNPNCDEGLELEERGIM